MRKFWILAAITIAVFSTATITPTKTAGQKGEVRRAERPVPNRYIVVLDDDALGGAAVEPVVEAQGQYLSAVYGGKVLEVYASALKGFSAEMTPKQAEAMNQDSSVLSIEEDGYISVSSVQPSAPWHLDRVDQRALPMDTNYGYTASGAGVHVYIIDTGIRYTHSDFGGRANAVFDSINDGQNGNDCNGHGTHVAGIVGSATYGVAKNALLHSVRVLPCSGSGQLTDLLSGINWVTANHLSPAVANISITAAGSSAAIESGVTNSIASGVTYTIAAGNAAVDACGYTPARVPNAITVGATSDTDIRPGYSNFGPCLDIFAPGHSITSLSNANDTDVRSLSGTSMAAPLVAGVAALYLSANPTASAATVTNAIKSSATTGAVTNIDATSANLLLYSRLTGLPNPTPTPTPTATPTPTPTPSPSGARVQIRKQVSNTAGTSANIEFPYSATNLSSASFALVNNATYDDPNVTVVSGQTAVTVIEAPVPGMRLTAISCLEVSTGLPNVVNSTVDVANQRANIIVEPGENVTCTFLSEPMSPTAANASISGRVITSEGLGIRGASLKLTNLSTGQEYRGISNAFGFYYFPELPVADFYLLTISSKSYSFGSNSRSFTLNDNVSDLDFVGTQ